MIDELMTTTDWIIHNEFVELLKKHKDKRELLLASVKYFSVKK